jgi:hypothetical protein
MKKITFILGGLFLVTLALSSCKKDYTCECTDATDGSKTTISLPNTTKKLADDACKVYEIGGDACDLK